MKLHFKKLLTDQDKKIDRHLSTSGGTYSMVITAVVLAVLVAVNVFSTVLPTSLTRFDISASKLYSVTSNTKAVLNNMDKDVTIYWIVQADQEDSVIENLLNKYESLSDHVTVVKKNPDIYPNFAAEYTDETVANNSLVVECGDKSRYIAYSSIYPSETDYTTYSSSYSFDGEGQITSAINYCLIDELPLVYVLSGHGESDLPSDLTDQITKANFETKELSLLTVDEIPEDAAAILIYAPSSDISEEEKDMLVSYADNGGKILACVGPTEDGILTNFAAILDTYGITTNEGVVVEGDRDHYAFQAPYVLMPDMAEDDITSSLISEGYNPIMPAAGGLTVTGSSSATVTELLTTSDSSFSKIAGYSLTTYDKEDGDIDGPFAVAVSIETTGSGQIIWFTSPNFMDDTNNSYSSGANINLGMNALTKLVGENDSMSIRSKSLDYSYLTISSSTAGLLKTVMIGICPAVYLLIGIMIFMNRRRKQNV